MVNTPQFKELRFETEELFQEWLKATTAKVIRLEDLGQDMQVIHVHETGEILHCDWNSRIYNGKFMSNPEVGKPLIIDGDTYARLIVESMDQK